VALSFDPASVHVFDRTTGKNRRYDHA